MKYVHSIKQNHWGFRAAIQYPLLPYLLGDQGSFRDLNKLGLKVGKETTLVEELINPKLSL